MKNLFKQYSGEYNADTGLVRNINEQVDILRSHIVQNVTKIPSSVSRMAFSTENLHDTDLEALGTYGTKVRNAVVNAIGTKLATDTNGNLLGVFADAGAMAGVMAGDLNGYFARESLSNSPKSSPGKSYVRSTGVADAYTDSVFKQFAKEAYDEVEQKQAMVYSIIYNAQAARQDEFSETLFRTTLVSPDQVGLGITIRLMTVFDDFKRNINGNLDNIFNRKNILRAYENPEILKNEQTLMTPVYRSGAGPSNNTNYFMNLDDGLGNNILERAATIEGEVIQTAPLKCGERFDLLGITSTDTLIANGMLGPEDTIDPAIRLKELFVRFRDLKNSTGDTGDYVVQLDTRDFTEALFTYSTQGNYRVMTLNFEQNSVLFTHSAMRNKVWSNTAGVPDALEKAIGHSTVGAGDPGLMARLRVSATGMVNIQTGEAHVYGNHISIAYLAEKRAVLDSSGAIIGYEYVDIPEHGVATNGIMYDDLADLFGSATIEGWTPISYRTNLNRRQRGQLIDTTYQTQLYNVPMRGPITALHPVTSDGSTDASDLSTLITATHIRTSNAAVGELLRVKDLLKEWVNIRNNVDVGPDLLGIARYLVIPQYVEAEIDYLKDIDSLKSHERAEDLQAVLVNKLRDIAYNIYRDSQYMAVANAIAGGVAQAPEVILATDPVIARYLTVAGDLRTLGGEFNVRIVQTLDRRIRGKLFMAFGQFGEGETDGPNPLHFGTMAWKPELTVTLPISRSGQISKELTVQPSFLHFVNCPILASIDVKNLSRAFSKVAMNTHSV